MKNVQDPREIAPRNALVRHPKDLLPSWRDSADLFPKCADIVLSFGFTTTVICNTPLTLAHIILWRLAWSYMEALGHDWRLC